MLVLSRRKKQTILSEDRIVVRVLEIGHRQATVGIGTPADVEIVADEVVAKQRHQRLSRRTVRRAA
jgi:carbon storage regulator CsrA